MLINLALVIVNRAYDQNVIDICDELKLPAVLTVLGHGTAKDEHLKLYGLEETEKAALITIADSGQTKQLIKQLRRKLSIDIPGNGILACVPLKSVGGGKILSYITKDMNVTEKAPDLSVSHELILCIINQGFSDDVMSAARSAGATGGTVLHAKGTGADYARKFLGVSLASEKQIILIVAESGDKSAIMKAVTSKTGPHTPAGAICLSLPVTEVAGLREKL